MPPKPSLLAVLMLAAGGLAACGHCGEGDSAGSRRDSAADPADSAPVDRPDAPDEPPSGVQRPTFSWPEQTLRIEVLHDNLLHFEIGNDPTEGAIPVSPMVATADFPGPTSFTADAGGLRTGELVVTVDPAEPCFAVATTAGRQLTRTCLDGAGLTLRRLDTAAVFGLGEEFRVPGDPHGDWIGDVRTPGNEFGNRMVGFSGGAVGNLQVPFMMALDPDGRGYGLFLDEPRALTWDFRSDTFTVDGDVATWRGYLFAGDAPLSLRRQYLEIVGLPPVPPRQAFGLWVSEYGYDDWFELTAKLASLESAGFPVDGFVLDLQWYGGITSWSEETRMGSLDWDTERFPEPAAEIATLRQMGVGIVTIEQPYVGRALPEHADLAARGFLVEACAGCDPVFLDDNGWWGLGGMIDFTDPAAADYWHDTKRQSLAELGVFGHWTDLGEPELFDPDGWYDGAGSAHGQADAHNLYNLAWTASVARGYERRGLTRRPFILTRSGTAGTQRYGAALWSGDIGSNLDSLAAHLRAQRDMSISGFDYFGSDVGGFHRGSVAGDTDEMYTQWLAASLMLDVPVRPHTENLCNCRETAPSLIGDVASNLANVRLRYRLVPYLYSLAHRAHLAGEPVFPPLAFYWPADPVARVLGDTKLIGCDLLVAITAGHGARERDVYLPAGRWVDWHDLTTSHSAGEYLRRVPLYRDGRYTLPLYLREGAIIPLALVDAQTINALGQRRGAPARDELVVRAVPGTEATEFTLYEDDGQTTAYLAGEVRTTTLRQVREGDAVRVTLEAASGSYDGAPAARDNVVDLVLPGEAVSDVRLGGELLEQRTDVAMRADISAPAGGPGWSYAGGILSVRTGVLPVDVAKELTVTLAPP